MREAFAFRFNGSEWKVMNQPYVCSYDESELDNYIINSKLGWSSRKMLAYERGYEELGECAYRDRIATPEEVPVRLA